jgi:hypothetical protein
MSSYQQLLDLGAAGACGAAAKPAIRTATEDPPFADLLVNPFSFDVAFRPGRLLRVDRDAVDAVWGPRLAAAFRR